MSLIQFLEVFWADALFPVRDIQSPSRLTKLIVCIHSKRNRLRDRQPNLYLFSIDHHIYWFIFIAIYLYIFQQPPWYVLESLESHT